ncbi:MAG: IS630 family transposase, partial [Planctomycetes bacterium]|nr:IS630 family transposase [Planctomycetota bacterium]
LDMAEIGPGIPGRQGLDRRIDNMNEPTREVAAWETRRNAADAKANRRFTMGDARIRLRRLYPSIED